MNEKSVKYWQVSGFLVLNILIIKNSCSSVIQRTVCQIWQNNWLQPYLRIQHKQKCYSIRSTCCRLCYYLQPTNVSIGWNCVFLLHVGRDFKKYADQIFLKFGKHLKLRERRIEIRALFCERRNHVQGRKCAPPRFHVVQGFTPVCGQWRNRLLVRWRLLAERSEFDKVPADWFLVSVASDMYR